MDGAPNIGYANAMRRLFSFAVICSWCLVSSGAHADLNAGTTRLSAGPVFAHTLVVGPGPARSVWYLGGQGEAGYFFADGFALMVNLMVVGLGGDWRVKAPVRFELAPEALFISPRGEARPSFGVAPVFGWDATGNSFEPSYGLRVFVGVDFGVGRRTSLSGDVGVGAHLRPQDARGHLELPTVRASYASNR